MSERLSVRRVLDQTIDLVSDHFPALFTIGLIAGLPGLLYSLFEPAEPNAPVFEGAAGMLLLFMAIMIVATAWWLLASSALLLAADDAAAGALIERRSAFDRAIDAYPRVLGGTLLGGVIAAAVFMVMGVAAVFPFMLAAIPGLELFGLLAGFGTMLVVALVAVPFLFAPLFLFLPAILLFDRRTGIVESVQRAFAMMKGRRAPASAILLLALSVIWIPCLAWSFGTDFYNSAFDTGLAMRFVFTLVAVLIGAVVAPVFAGAVVFSYRSIEPRLDAAEPPSLAPADSNRFTTASESHGS